MRRSRWSPISIRQVPPGSPVSRPMALRSMTRGIFGQAVRRRAAACRPRHRLEKRGLDGGGPRAGTGARVPASGRARRDAQRRATQRRTQAFTRQLPPVDGRAGRGRSGRRRGRAGTRLSGSPLVAEPRRPLLGVGGAFPRREVEVERPVEVGERHGREQRLGVGVHGVAEEQLRAARSRRCGHAPGRRCDPRCSRPRPGCAR